MSDPTEQEVEELARIIEREIREWLGGTATRVGHSTNIAPAMSVERWFVIREHTGIPDLARSIATAVRAGKDESNA